MKTLLLRKFSPIDRERSIFEVVLGDTVIVDITTSESGELELAFHEACSSNLVVPLQPFLALIEEARTFLQEEMQS